MKVFKRVSHQFDNFKGVKVINFRPIATNSNQKCFGIDEKAVGHQVIKARR